MTMYSDTWKFLLSKTFLIIDEIQKAGTPNPFWTFGGGTVLMLRYNHRFSKDVDIFVPDPQYLGFVTPRLNNVAESISANYVESSNVFVKLLLEEGEIDFVASPNLTSIPFEEWELLNRLVRVETATEIVAKKLWHRGHAATARDLFDLSLVIEKEPHNLIKAKEFLQKNSTVFISDVKDRYRILEKQFEEIVTLEYSPTFDDALQRSEAFLMSL